MSRHYSKYFNVQHKIVVRANASIGLKRLLTHPCIRSIQVHDYDIICNWILTREDLSLVSGDNADRLTNQILNSWIKKSELSLVIANPVNNQPIGFCTLSKKECVFLPDRHIEICHFIIAPEYRYLFVAYRLANFAVKCASQLGYEFLIGRILPQNLKAIAAACFCGFDEVSINSFNLPKNFRWFRFEVNNLNR